MHLFSVGNSSGYYLWQPAVTVSLHSCSMQRSGTMGSISGTSIVSLMLLLGEGKKPWCPLGDGLWKDWLLKRAAPEKDGAAMPGEWARLEGRVGKEKGEKSKFKRVQCEFFDHRSRCRGVFWSTSLWFLCILCSSAQRQTNAFLTTGKVSYTLFPTAAGVTKNVFRHFYILF